MLTWRVQPRVEERADASGWLGVIGVVATNQSIAAAEERIAVAERRLSTSEKLLIAGFVLQLAVFSWQVYQWRRSQ